MKKNCILLIGLVFRLTIYSQIPNPSFEAWNNNQPNGWHSYYNPLPMTETQTGTAFTGTSALKSTIMNPGAATFAVESGVVTGSSSTNYYIPLGPKPTKLFGQYILSTVINTLTVNVFIKSSGTIIATGVFTANTSSGVFTSFTTNITYSSIAVPDSFKIDISFNGPGPGTTFSASIGDYFIIDDLSFDINNSISETTADPFIRMFPNPILDKVTFQLSEFKNKIKKVEMFGAQGQWIVTHYVDERRYDLDLSELNEGLYFFKITLNDDKAITKKIIKN